MANGSSLLADRTQPASAVRVIGRVIEVTLAKEALSRDENPARPQVPPRV
jgi:hypothetical protein